MGCGYFMAKAAMTSTLNVFFKRVEVVNGENLPTSGPLIIVANHQNQFVDPMIMLKSAGKRQVSFIIAEKSMHRPVIGDVARALNAVPVIRPQDKAKVGAGAITSVDLEARTLVGEGTNFMVDCEQKGCLVSIKGVGQFAIDTVISDTEVSFKPIPADKPVNMENFTDSNPFKVIPKISQDEVFQAVYDRLAKDGCIGIFPEGGSHDRTNLLPLKAGVSLMALGACAQGNTDVKIVALGINYFGGHVFRSRAFVDVAKPIEIDEKLISMFVNGNKKEACGKLMDEIRESLESVTLRAPDYDVLKAVRTARRMYQNGAPLDSKNYMKLNQRFTLGYERWKDENEYIKLLTDIHTYLKFAFAQGLTDKEVRDLPPLGNTSTLCYAWFGLLRTMVLLLIVLPIILPGLILNLPIALRTQCIVQREMKKALAGSSVKIAARDVAASQKIMAGALMIPVLLLIYTAAIILLGYFFWPYMETATGHGDAYDFIVQNAWWLAGIFFLFVFPLYTFYFCVVLGEIVYRRAKLIPSYLLCITSVCRSNKRNPAEWLRQDRKRLVVRVQQYIEQHIHEIPEWAEDRVISTQEIKARRSERTKAILETNDLTPQLSVQSSVSFSKVDPEM